MTRTQHLIVILGEEGVEVSQRTTKALRFGIDEIQPEQPLNNASRIMQEMADMIGVYEMLQSEGVLPPVNRDMIEAKKIKVENFLKYSESLGLVSDI